MLNSISNQYALALFDIAKESNNVEQYYEMIYDIKEYFSIKDFNKLLTHPQISKSEKKNLLKGIFNENVTKEILNFLYVLIDNSRINYFVEIVEEYKMLKNIYNNVMEIKAYSRHKLTKENIRLLETSLSKKFNATIEIENIIDETNIAGTRLEYNGNVIDDSLKAKIIDLKLSLKG